MQAGTLEIKTEQDGARCLYRALPSDCLRQDTESLLVDQTIRAYVIMRTFTGIRLFK